MIYSNAGHSPPLLAREDGHVLRLEAGGPVLGVFHGAVYAEHSCVMEIGDLLLMYSDGVTEGSNPAGEEFGEERLEGMLREAGGRTARQVVSWVMETVNEWSGGQPLADDVTLLAARRTG
jgi:sigma-B regulation protein RsbU (phosphoserine phosphatase)